MFTVQELIDAVGAVMATARSKYHLTLGGLIRALEAEDQGHFVILDTGGSPGELRSYRGHYEDLAFEPTTQARRVEHVLADALNARGASFEGYKGGRFTMTSLTPLWVARYGSLGRAVVGLELRGGALTLLTRDVE